jgi:hypothetical protein
MALAAIKMKNKANITLTFLVLLMCTQNFACSCNGHRTTKEGFDSADLVAKVSVISIEEEWIPDSTRLKLKLNNGVQMDTLEKRLLGFSLKRVTLVSKSLYKGKAFTDTLVVYTGRNGGDCGYGFEIGKDYILYANQESYLQSFFDDQEFPKGEDVYWTNICTRTQSFNQEEIEEIVKIKAVATKKEND